MGSKLLGRPGLCGAAAARNHSRCPAAHFIMVEMVEGVLTVAVVVQPPYLQRHGDCYCPLGEAQPPRARLPPQQGQQLERAALTRTR
jgi:hypothetical protein